MTTSRVDSDLWVILLASSRYYFNYRHFANTASIYSIVKALGVDDSHIFWLDASDVLNDFRNPLRGEAHYEDEMLFPGKIDLLKSFYPISANLSAPPPYQHEVDYRGDEVNIELLQELFLHKLPLTSRSKILFYMTGHGGDEFFKFNDYEEFNAVALFDLFQQLYYHQRYDEILLITDTCQASTMASTDSLLSKVPGVTVLASSQRGENSYSYYPDEDLGIPIIDRFTFRLYHFFYINYLKDLKAKKQQQQINSKRLSTSAKRLTLKDLHNFIDPDFISSTPSIQQSKNVRRPANKMYLLDFFSNIALTDSGQISHQTVQTKLSEFLPFGDQLKLQRNISKTAVSDTQLNKKVMIDGPFGFPVFFIFTLLCLLKAIHYLLR
eukprot:gene13621-15009_t